MLILTAVRNTRQPRAIFVAISIMIILAYLIKPYTYDLNKYSIYFHTGFIPVHSWHSPSDNFKLDLEDRTGEVFGQGFEFGFRWLAKTGNIIFPRGSLVPRIDADFGDFKERGPPRSDAMIFLIMGLGFFVLLAAVRFLSVRTNGNVGSYFRSTDLIVVIPIILGSAFVMLGSQNTLRQFLGVAFVVLAMSSMISKRYFVSAILVALSAAFHQWAPVLGLVGIYLVVLGRVGLENRSVGEVEPFRLSRPEVLALTTGVMLVVLVRTIMLTGAFNIEVPLLGDLKPFIINDSEFISLERLSSLIKVSVLVGLVLTSEVLIGKTKGIGSTSDDIRSLRRRAFVLILPLAVYPEVFARVLVLYWAVEMIFLVWALNSDQIRVRLGGAMVFISYGFAPNAINILVGPNWLYNF